MKKALILGVSGQENTGVIMFDPCEIKSNAEIKANAGIYLTAHAVRLKLYRLNQASLPATRRQGAEEKTQGRVEH